MYSTALAELRAEPSAPLSSRLLVLTHTVGSILRPPYAAPRRAMESRATARKKRFIGITSARPLCNRRAIATARDRASALTPAVSGDWQNGRPGHCPDPDS